MSLPNPKRGSKPPRGGALPQPEAGGDFDPFLKASDIGKLGATGSIQVCGAPEESESEFSDATMPVRFRGHDYALGIKWSGGNYARLFKKFGANPKKWKGSVKVEIKRFKKRDYVAVV
jgi:hypothetical protein